MNLKLGQVSIKPEVVRDLFYASLLLLAVDYGYKFYLSFQQEGSSCLIITVLPTGIREFYKYIVELALLVFAGTYIAYSLQTKLKPNSFFIPRNPFHAFIYASLLPVCSCSVIPFIPAIRERSGYSTVITFILSAAILNPFIIILSFSILGWKYAVLRIGASFILSVGTGYIVSAIFRKLPSNKNSLSELCTTSCTKSQGVENSTVETFFKLLPYIVVAGFISMIIDLGGFVSNIQSFFASKSVLMPSILSLVAVPLYFCNGSEIILLQSISVTGSLPLGGAIAFTLGASAVCISSIALLLKVLGKVQTITFVATIFILMSAIGITIQNVIDW